MRLSASLSCWRYGDNTNCAILQHIQSSVSQRLEIIIKWIHKDSIDDGKMTHTFKIPTIYHSKAQHNKPCANWMWHRIELGVISPRLVCIHCMHWLTMMATWLIIMKLKNISLPRHSWHQPHGFPLQSCHVRIKVLQMTENSTVASTDWSN